MILRRRKQLSAAGKSIVVGELSRARRDDRENFAGTRINTVKPPDIIG